MIHTSRTTAYFMSYFGCNVTRCWTRVCRWQHQVEGIKCWVGSSAGTGGWRGGWRRAGHWHTTAETPTRSKVDLFSAELNEWAHVCHVSGFWFWSECLNSFHRFFSFVTLNTLKREWGLSVEKFQCCFSPVVLPDNTPFSSFHLSWTSDLQILSKLQVTLESVRAVRCDV